MESISYSRYCEACQEFEKLYGATLLSIAANVAIGRGGYARTICINDGPRYTSFKNPRVYVILRDDNKILFQVNFSQYEWREALNRAMYIPNAANSETHN